MRFGIMRGILEAVAKDLRLGGRIVAAGAMGWFEGTYAFETNQAAARGRPPSR